MTHTISPLAAGLLLSLAAASSQAALEARAGGTLVYDTDRDITWVADANLFRTQAAAMPGLVANIIANVGSVPTIGGPHPLSADDFDADTGRLNWWGAQAWVSQLTYAGASDWRLPTHPCTDWAPACTVYGANQPASEMGHLFYEALGGVFSQAISVTHGPAYGLFSNVQDAAYWTGTQGVFPFNPNGAYAASFGNGDQYLTWQYIRGLHAWAVHDGDIGAAPVPEPASWALLGAGLLGLGILRRRRAG